MKGNAFSFRWVSLILIISLVLSLALSACGNTDTQDKNDNKGTPAETETSTDNQKEDHAEAEPKDTIEEKTLSLGDTASTDILDFTLEYAAYAIALHDGKAADMNEIYLPKEFDPSRDKNNQKVAPVGHTLISYQFVCENKDRVAIELGHADGQNDAFISISYGDEVYSDQEKQSYAPFESKDGYDWELHDIYRVRIEPLERLIFRKYTDIPTEVSDFSEDIVMTFSLPTSSGEYKDFKYVVTEADRNDYLKKEITLEEALTHFSYSQGKQYFENHKDEYASMTSEEIDSALTNSEWNIGGLFTKGNTISFDGNGSSVDSYNTVRAWETSDNMLKMSMGTTDIKSLELRRINDSAILVLFEGAPYFVFYK